MTTTANQKAFLEGLASGKAAARRKRDKNPWLDCASDTYRTACSLHHRGLIELNPGRDALGDFRARLLASD